jgi:hypothetical protein
MLAGCCCVGAVKAQGLIRRGAKLNDKQQQQERICVRFYGALVLQGEPPLGPAQQPLARLFVG